MTVIDWIRITGRTSVRHLPAFSRLRRRAKTRSMAIFCLLIVCFFTHPGLARDKEEEQKKLEVLKSRIKTLQQELQDRDHNRDQQSQALRNTEVSAGNLRKQIHTTEQQLKTLQQQLAELDQRRGVLQQSKKDQEKLIGQHINAAYRLGREEHIKLLLNEQEPARFNRLLKYHDYFLQARADKVKTYLDTMAELAEVESATAEKEQQQLAHRDRLKNNQRDLNHQIQQRKLTLSKLDKAISNDRQRLDKLERERKALEQVIKTLEQTIAELALPNNTEPFARRQGKLDWPVKGRLKQRFGSPRKADIRWNGWLLSARAGSPVQAVHHGRVVFSDYLRGHGLLLIIDHGDGYMSLYAHNQVLLKDTGDWVQTGETIARVGNSGGLSDSALYFEIRKNSRPRNPSKWLKRG